MSKLSTAQECGLRLKRIRDAKNLTQQELATMVHLSPQAISKYEKNGISDINIIQKLTSILGYDLLTDEQNEEGTVGEVGKEILFKLIENNGFIEVGQLIAEMYGLDNNRITDEIVKLRRIGMVVREQYVDFYDFKIDGLFITAKGIICIKNLLPNRGRDTDYEDMISETKSYELIVQKDNSYQDYFEKNKIEKIIRRLPCAGVYRIDFVQHLLKNYTDDYYGLNTIKDEYGVFEALGCKDPEIYPLLQGENFYFDVLYRMAIEFDNEKIQNYILSSFDESSWDEEQEYSRLSVELGKEEESIIRMARWKFEELSNGINEFMDDWEGRKEEGSLQNISSDEKISRYIELKNKTEGSFFASEVEDMDYFMLSNKKWETEESPYPIDWYSIDEIWDYIKANYHPATSKEEKILDEKLRELTELNPRVMEYYDFPKTWEDAGIGNYIRELYNISPR